MSPKTPILIYERSYNPNLYSKFKKSINDDIQSKIKKLSSSKLLHQTCHWLLSQIKSSESQFTKDIESNLEFSKKSYSVYIEFNGDEYTKISRNLREWSFDVSNLEKVPLLKIALSRPFFCAQSWAICLFKELKLQSEYELTNKISKTTTNLEVSEIPKFQIFFYEEIALPFFLAVEKILPGLNFMIKGIEKNLVLWKRLKSISSRFDNNDLLPSVGLSPLLNGNANANSYNFFYPDSSNETGCEAKKNNSGLVSLLYYHFGDKIELGSGELCYLEFVYSHSTLKSTDIKLPKHSSSTDLNFFNSAGETNNSLNESPDNHSNTTSTFYC
ncbi:hypothetical protein AYI68_g1718 [Smittium mucronatum]|uniref:PDEase domain-containing protein n=1 Tax=Smittium mucronatum TaxID=133383 RepID=A0A1R0H4U2_9FUNG|nr:hypothetical protein AYI68_g1718 [Smittium mucronatum]